MNLSDIWLRLRALVFRESVEREMKEELDFHLEATLQGMVGVVIAH